MTQDTPFPKNPAPGTFRSGMRNLREAARSIAGASSRSASELLAHAERQQRATRDRTQAEAAHHLQEKNITALACLAKLAYVENGPEEIAETLTRGEPPLETSYKLLGFLTGNKSIGTNIFGFAAEKNGQLILSLRGTKTPFELVTQAMTSILVSNRGAAIAYRNQPLYTEMARKLTREITDLLKRERLRPRSTLVLGHSMGGALATIVGDELTSGNTLSRENTEVISFGAPPTRLVAAGSAATSESKESPVAPRVLRICVAGDPVPGLFLRLLAHDGKEILLTGDGAFYAMEETLGSILLRWTEIARVHTQEDFPLEVRALDLHTRAVLVSCINRWDKADNLNAPRPYAQESEFNSHSLYLGRAFSNEKFALASHSIARYITVSGRETSR